MKGKRILLVEDNPGDVELICELLTRRGRPAYRIDIVTRLSDALDFLIEDPADIVLLDLGLPDSRGVSAIREIKDRYPPLPVIVITGNDDETLGAEAVKEGAQDYIVKGMIPEHYLTQAIEYAIYRQDSEARLKQSEEKYRSIVENIGLGIAMIDRNKTILETNARLRQWFPALLPGMSGKCYNYFGGLCGEDPDHLACPVSKTLNDGSIHKAVNKIGNRTYRIVSSPLKTETGAIKGAILIKEDITDRLSIESKLRQAQKMESLGTLSGGIAHDFNNILTAIQGYATLAKASASPGSSLDEDLDEILRASDRASDLVRQILTFSRMAEVEKQPVRIDVIVKEALRLLRSTLPSNIEIRNAVEEIREKVIADHTHIHQIMMNLCTNAAHAMEEKGGRLDVRLKKTRVAPDAPGDLEPGQYLLLTVTDTGCGIPAAIMDSIFDPYFTTKGIGDGTGLGLSMVQGIVKDCGGGIFVRSKEGEGSCFSVFLPVCRPRDYRPPAPEKQGSLRGKETILIVDDENSILKLCTRLLGKYGYTTRTASNGNDALAYLNTHHDDIDLIISDMTMPKMTGLELAEALRDSPHARPILIMSGYSRMLSSDKIQRAGVKAVVTKPLMSAEFLGTIRQILDGDASLN